MSSGPAGGAGKTVVAYIDRNPVMQKLEGTLLRVFTG